MWTVVKWRSHNQKLKHENKENYETYLKSMLMFEKNPNNFI